MEALLTPTITERLPLLLWFRAFGTVISDSLHPFLECEDLLSDHQYGCYWRCSTGNLLTLIPYSWSVALGNHRETPLISLNIPKEVVCCWNCLRSDPTRLSCQGCHVSSASQTCWDLTWFYAAQSALWLLVPHPRVMSLGGNEACSFHYCHKRNKRTISVRVDGVPSQPFSVNANVPHLSIFAPTFS